MNNVARRKIVLLLIVVAALFGFSAVVTALERGPYVCTNGCAVQTPLIDAKTAAFLDSVLAPIDRVPFVMYSTGTTYIICNSSHCTTYRMTFNGEFVGSERTPIEGGSSGGSGGGGGGGSGGGVPGGGQSGGCQSNCGKVEVGKPRPA